MAITSVEFRVNGGTIYEEDTPLSSYTSFYIANFPVQAPATDTPFTGRLTWNGANKTITFSRNGYTLKEWNTAADGTGTSADAGDVVAQSKASYIAKTWYAIWEEHSDPSSVSILLGVNEIASITNSGTEVLETDGTFLTDDITIDFTNNDNSSVTVQLENTTIVTMSDTETQVLETGGTYLTEDITVTLQ